ncbi:hypothetical protein PAXINDRAFT_165022 [Paxillus involutus ATCC 200175]|nr:hypothetical protein PAXINDRAFT_165022 [Paxillus involutus ATCC 200175]
MFVISPVSALHSSASHPHYCPPRPSARDRYLAAIAQAEADFAHAQALEQQRAREAYARRQHQENIRRQLILDTFYPKNDVDYDHDYDLPYTYSRCPANLKRPRPYSAYAQEIAERNARKRQVGHEHEARLNEWKKVVTARRNQEEERRCARQAHEILDMFTRPRAAEPKQEPKRENAQQRPEEDVTLKDRLESRLMNEYQSDIRDALQSILDSLSPIQSVPAPEPASGHAPGPAGIQVIPVSEHVPEPTKDTKGKSKQVTFDLPTATATATATDSDTDSEAEAEADPSSIQSSLSVIDEIDASLRTLKSEFEFPEELDFTPSADGSELKLAYSSRNAPLRFYDHALSQLLSRLDAIPSYGSRKVRDARKIAVRNVENALEEVDRAMERKKDVAAWKAVKARANLQVEAEPKTHATEVAPGPIEVPVTTVEPLVIPPTEPAETPQEKADEVDHGPSALAEPQPSEPESAIAVLTSSPSLTTDKTSTFVIPASIIPNTVEPSADPSPIQSLVNSTVEPPSASVTQPTSAVEPCLTSVTITPAQNMSSPESDAPVPHSGSLVVTDKEGDTVNIHEPVLVSPAYLPVPTPAPASLPVLYAQPVVTEIQPSSPSTESSVSADDDNEEVPVMQEEEAVAVDGFLLAPSSPSMFSTSLPVHSEDDGDAVLIDSEHEDSWSEVDA